MKTLSAAGLAIALLAGAIRGSRTGPGPWAGLQSKPAQPAATHAATEHGSMRDRAILYWKHPDGAADYSPSPQQTADGRDYLPVYEDQEADFKDAKPAKTKGD